MLHFGTVRPIKSLKEIKEMVGKINIMSPVVVQTSGGALRQDWMWKREWRDTEGAKDSNK